MNLGVADPAGRPAPGGRRRLVGLARRAHVTQPTMRGVGLVPDVDYASVAAAALAGHVGPEELGSHLSRAWAEMYWSRVPHASLLEFDSDGARFLFDLASAAGAERADRTVAAWGRSRPAPRPRDEAYQRGIPHHKAAQTDLSTRATWWPTPPAAPSDRTCFAQDRELNRGWSVEGRRYRALEREIANTPGTFFFCCLLYADDTDFPAAVELGVLRADGLQVERFRNRFDL